MNNSFQLRTSISQYLCQFSGSTCSLSSTRISCYCCHLLDSLKFFVISIEGHNLDNPYLNLNLQPKYITVVTKGWSKPSIPGNEFNSLIAPLFDQRLYIENAVPSGTRLVTTHPHPLSQPNNPPITGIHFHESQRYVALLRPRGGERVTKWIRAVL